MQPVEFQVDDTILNYKDYSKNQSSVLRLNHPYSDNNPFGFVIALHKPSVWMKELDSLLEMVIRMASKACKNPYCNCDGCKGCDCTYVCVNETCNCNKESKDLNSTNDG